MIQKNSIYFFICLHGIFINSKISAQNLSANDIANRNYITSKVIDSSSDSTFKLINNSGQERIRDTIGQTKLIKGTKDNMRLVTFLSPSDVKGTKTLMIEHTGKDDDIWIYLPALKKVRRLVSNNKKDSFVGTDFSYGDVIGHKVNEWTHTLVKEEEIEGAACYVIESMPKDATVKANTGYAKRISWIKKDNFVTVKSIAYDEANELLKEATYKRWKEVEAIKHRWQAGILEAKNLQTGHQTVITIDQSKYNTGVKDDFFTTRYMEQQ